MPVKVFRRIQKTGGSTYTLSLPKNWVEKRLKKGDAVQIIEQGSELLISCGGPAEKQTAMLSLESNEPKLVRELIAHYVEGFDKFIVNAPKASHNAIKKQVKQRIPGLEAIEENNTSLVFQNLLTHTEISFHATLKRLDFLTQSLLEKITEQNKISEQQNKISEQQNKNTTQQQKNNEQRKNTAQQHNNTGQRQSLEAAEELEMEVDRFFILAFRQLGHNQQTDSDAHQHAIYYVLVIKSLEKIADHALIFLKQSPAARKRLEKQCRIAVAAYNQAMQSLFKKNALLAEKTIEYIQEQRLQVDRSEVNKSKVDRNEVNQNDFLAYNLLRILDYSTDIAEMAIDMYCHENRG